MNTWRLAVPQAHRYPFDDSTDLGNELSAGSMSDTARAGQSLMKQSIQGSKYLLWSDLGIAVSVYITVGEAPRLT
jgi:hypothetical protein